MHFFTAVMFASGDILLRLFRDLGFIPAQSSPRPPSLLQISSLNLVSPLLHFAPSPSLICLILINHFSSASPLSFMCLLRHISMILSLFHSPPLVSAVVCSRPRCHLLLLLSTALLSHSSTISPPLFFLLSPLAHSLAPTVILPPHLGSATLLGGRGSRCVFACWVCSQSQLWADGGWSHSHSSPCLLLCPPQAGRHAKS